MAGRIRCSDRVPGRVPLPGQQPVQHVEVRDVGGVDPRVLPARGRQHREHAERPGQPDGEDQLEQVGQHEDRDDHPGQRGADREGVEPAAGALGGPVAERDAHHDGEDQRRDGQLEGGREALDERLQHGLAGARRAAEVALQQLRGVDQVLLEQRLVEAVLGVHRGDRLRGGLLAEQRPGRVAGQGPDPDEQQHDEPEQHRDHQQDAPDDESEHAGLPPPRMVGDQDVRHGTGRHPRAGMPHRDRQITGRR